LGSSEFLHLFRNKRQVSNSTSSPGSGNEENDCVQRILINLEKKLNSSLTPLKNVSKASQLGKPHLLFSDSDTNNFEKFCKIYKGHRSRLIKCPQSNVKRFALNGLAIVEYMCIEHFSEFMKSFPCLQQVDKDIDLKCRPKCKEYENAAEQLNSQGSTVGENKTKEQVEKVFADSCQYVMCVMKCESPNVKEKCGEQTVSLEEGAIGKTFTALEEIMNDSGNGAMWPTECKPLGQMGTSRRFIQ
jgi:hypothetical protein